MHNIKDIRSDIDKFIESISKRNIKLDKNEINNTIEIIKSTLSAHGVNKIIIWHSRS